MPDRSSPKPKGKSSISFWEKLKQVFPDVQCERRMSWLTVPVDRETTGVIAEVRSALIEHCGFSQSEQRYKKKECTPALLAEKLSRPARRKLEFDFFIPEVNLAFEFDERQHFTIERAVALGCYGGAIEAGFDIEEWMKKCYHIKATDPDPIWRDWQRAYRDAVRDIKASEYGVRLVRYSYDLQPSTQQLMDLYDTLLPRVD